MKVECNNGFYRIIGTDFHLTKGQIEQISKVLNEKIEIQKEDILDFEIGDVYYWINPLNGCIVSQPVTNLDVFKESTQKGYLFATKEQAETFLKKLDKIYQDSWDKVRGMK